MRTARPPPLQNPDRSTHGRLRIHRGLVESSSLPFRPRLWEATIVFIDESRLSERPHRVPTWAPRGKTPVLQNHFNLKVLSAAAGITWWNFCFRLYPGAIHATEVIDFLRPSAAPPAGQAAGGLGRAAAAPGA